MMSVSCHFHCSPAVRLNLYKTYYTNWYLHTFNENHITQTGTYTHLMTTKQNVFRLCTHALVLYVCQIDYRALLLHSYCMR